MLQSVSPSEATQAAQREIFHSRGQKTHARAPLGFFFPLAIWLKIAKYLPQHIFSMSQGCFERSSGPLKSTLDRKTSKNLWMRQSWWSISILYFSNCVLTFSLNMTQCRAECMGAGADVTHIPTNNIIIITTSFRTGRPDCWLQTPLPLFTLTHQWTCLNKNNISTCTSQKWK